MVPAPSERTKAQRDNVFLFMRANVSHKSLNNTTLFLFVIIFRRFDSTIKLLCYAFFCCPPFRRQIRAEQQLKTELA